MAKRVVTKMKLSDEMKAVVKNDEEDASIPMAEGEGMGVMDDNGQSVSVALGYDNCDQDQDSVCLLQ